MAVLDGFTSSLLISDVRLRMMSRLSRSITWMPDSAYNRVFTSKQCDNWIEEQVRGVLLEM